ncbi:MAG: YSC84-related protein [Thermodesulfobacteriota bacterium]|jgi:lipid-binding SYLF domain-containing protein|nr:MAG: YSC84-related protein [Thermodesulfobacteriota bacterium]
MQTFSTRNLGKTVRLIFIGLAITIFGMFSHNAYAKTAAEINADANRTLKRFYKEVKGAKELTSSAKALLVMSGVTKAGFFVGGEYGQGVLRIKGKSQGYYNLVAGSYGFTFGGEQMDIIIAFMTEDALREFRKIKGWEVGVDGNVAMIDVGGGKRLDTTSLKDPVVAFVFGAKGLMVDVSLKGAKFTKINK